MGDFNDSARCFQKVVDSYDDYKFARRACFMVGQNYESMVEAGLISASEAEPKIRSAYEQLISDWPGCDDAEQAQTWLNKHNSKGRGGKMNGKAIFGIIVALAFISAAGLILLGPTRSYACYGCYNSGYCPTCQYCEPSSHSCQPISDGAECGACMECSGGSCGPKTCDNGGSCCGYSTCCDPRNCEECVDGQCVHNTCDPRNCEECVDGQCVHNTCDPSQCKDCNATTGQCEVCGGRPCEDCNYVTGACENKCKPELCQECDGAGHCQVCGGDTKKCCLNGECKNCCKSSTTGNCEAHNSDCGCDPIGWADCTGSIKQWTIGQTRFCWSECGGTPCYKDVPNVPCYAWQACAEGYFQDDSLCLSPPQGCAWVPFAICQNCWATGDAEVVREMDCQCE